MAETEKALKELAIVFNDYCKANGKDIALYAVGGFVRNTLLNLPINDIDICSALTPNEIIRFCNENNYKYVPKGLDFGMVEIHFLHRDSVLVLEHTTFRSDKYSNDGSHRPQSVTFSERLEHDAFRRDFTVNAIYKNLLTGEITDPTGGIDDLNARIIRATSHNPADIMHDDGLRIMRMVRFACELCFEVDESTMVAAIESIDGLRCISYERIRDELNKMLLSDIKYPSLVDEWSKHSVENSIHLLKTAENSPVLRSLITMRDMGVLEIIIPETSDCRDYAQKRRYHIYDVLEHLFHVCAETPPVLYMRLAGLLHDIGKPTAHRQNKGKNMHGHEIISSYLAQEVLKRLCYSNEIIQKVSRLISAHMYDIAGTAKINTLKTRFASWGESLVLDLIEFRRADIRGSGNPSRTIDTAERFCDVYIHMRSSGTPFSMSDLAVNGTDIIRALRLKPSSIIGKIKYELLRHCAIYPEDNNYAKLIELANMCYGRIKKQKEKQ